MANLTLDKTTYRVGDEITIRLDFSKSLAQLENASNLNFSIFRADLERDNLVLSSGTDPNPTGGIIEVVRRLPDNCQEGLYFVSHLRLLYGEEQIETQNVAPENENSLYFWISNDAVLSSEQLIRKIQLTRDQRASYVNSETVTPSAQIGGSARKFKVIVFAVGCLLHASQTMRGFIIAPLGHGYNYDHMLKSVNRYVKGIYNIELERDNDIQNSFSASTPLFAIDYQNVCAESGGDAIEHCMQLCENIFTVLAYDRGQRPKAFASLSIDLDSNEILQSFHFPGYRGNLISDFSPSATANTLERLLPKLESSAWIDLIMRIHADAKSEQNISYSYLKYWQILELVAKKRVRAGNVQLKNPNGQTLLDNGGNAITTNSTLGRVYNYVVQAKLGWSFSRGKDGRRIIFETSEDATKNPNYDRSTEIVSLLDVLTSLYVIRNATAHAGEFDFRVARTGNQREKRAAELSELPNARFNAFIKSTVNTIVTSEIAAA